MHLETRDIIKLIVLASICISLYWYFETQYSDVAFCVCMICLLIFMYLQIPGASRSREYFAQDVHEEGQSEYLNTSAFQKLWKLGSTSGNIVWPSMDYMIKVFKGDNVPNEEGDGENANQDENAPDEDKVLLKHLQALGVDLKTEQGQEIAIKYHKLNFVMQHIQRMDKNTFDVFMMRYGGRVSQET